MKTTSEAFKSIRNKIQAQMNQMKKKGATYEDILRSFKKEGCNK